MKRFFIVFAFLLILLLPASLGFTLWSGKKNLEKTKTFLLSGDFKKAQGTALKASRSFEKVLSCLAYLPFSEKIPEIGDWAEVGESLADVAFHLAKTGESVEKIIGLVLGRESGDLKSFSQEAKIEIDLAWEELSLLEGILRKKPMMEIPKMREKTEKVRDFLFVLPEILPEEKRVYLFLLQNNMELRPTGGFIGSYALAIFENGKLLDFQVEDVYTADGQLKGHVEPPEPMKKYLGEGGWYLRDSNFDPDFPKTAETVKWFFQKETGRVVDGVIGVNFFVAQKILKVIGSVKLPDYQETITADNLFERAEYYSEVGFFPGSTQKRDFLGSLASQIFQEFSLTKDWLRIGEAIYESLEEKQILLNFNNEKVMTPIHRCHWDGRIREGPDYLMVVESNFGVNKSNYFLERKLNHEVEMKEEIEEKLTIHYQNNSPTQTWPGGNYKNYLRIYTPLGSLLLEVKINGEVLDLEKVDVSSASGKSVFGFLVNVPVGEEKEVSLKYKVPFKLEDMVSYAFLFQKQPGTGEDPLKVLISYPSSKKVVKITPDALTGPQAVLYNTNLSQDRLFTLEFAQ